MFQNFAKIKEESKSYNFLFCYKQGLFIFFSQTLLFKVFDRIKLHKKGSRNIFFFFT